MSTTYNWRPVLTKTPTIYPDTPGFADAKDLGLEAIFIIDASKTAEVNPLDPNQLLNLVRDLSDYLTGGVEPLTTLSGQNKNGTMIYAIVVHQNGLEFAAKSFADIQDVGVILFRITNNWIRKPRCFLDTFATLVGSCDYKFASYKRCEDKKWKQKC